MTLLILALCIACYLIGGIPFGYVVARARGVDIREQGSRNIGATNVSRVLGRRLGITVFFLDALKGLGPTLIAGWCLRRWADVDGAALYGPWLLAGACGIMGHIWPVYLKFRGGKGVATSLGVTLGIYPQLTGPCLMCFVVWIIVTGTTRYVSLGSLTAAVVFPIATALNLAPFVLAEQWPIMLYALALPALVIVRHRANITRLLQGTESKIGGPRAS